MTCGMRNGLSGYSHVSVPDGKPIPLTISFKFIYLEVFIMKVFKKIALFALASAMVLSFAACGGNDKKDTSSQPVSQTDVAVNPKDYAGTFMADRCVMTVEVENEKDVTIVVEWSNSADDMYRWEMSGWFDADTFRVVYSDSTKYTLTYDDKNRETKKVEYTDGMGRIQFTGKDELVWQDEQHPEYGEMTFTRG